MPTYITSLKKNPEDGWVLGKVLLNVKAGALMLVPGKETWNGTFNYTQNLDRRVEGLGISSWGNSQMQADGFSLLEALQRYESKRMSHCEGIVSKSTTVGGMNTSTGFKARF